MLLAWLNVKKCRRSGLLVITPTAAEKFKANKGVFY